MTPSPASRPMSAPAPTSSMPPRCGASSRSERVSEATSKPLNVLARPDLSMSEIVAAGGRRISVGSWLAMAAISEVVDAAKAMRDAGDFSSLRAPAELNEWLDAR